jgi:hypothetical protein
MNGEKWNNTYNQRAKSTLYDRQKCFFCPVLHHTNTVNVIMVTFPLYWWRKTLSAPPCIISAMNEPPMSQTASSHEKSMKGGGEICTHSKYQSDLSSDLLLLGYLITTINSLPSL